MTKISNYTNFPATLDILDSDLLLVAEKSHINKDIALKIINDIKKAAKATLK